MLLLCFVLLSQLNMPSVVKTVKRIVKKSKKSLKSVVRGLLPRRRSLRISLRNCVRTLLRDFKESIDDV